MKNIILNVIKKFIFFHVILNRVKFLLAKLLSSNTFGKNNYLDKSIHYIGLKHIKIGSNNVVSEDTWLNVNNRVDGEVGIEVGNQCYIGKRNFFSSGKKIVIGDFFMSGINCSFLGSDHVMDNPLEPYIFTGTTNFNSIVIGDNVWLGANVTILGDVHVGHGSIIGANSLVNRSIPPFSIAVGNPAKVIKRYDFSKKQWTKDFTELSGFLSEKEYKEELLAFTGRALSPFPAGKNFGDLF